MADALQPGVAPVISVDGAVNGQLAEEATRLEVEEDTAGMKRLSLYLMSQRPESSAPETQIFYLTGKVLDFGKRLQVSIGPQETARSVFDGYISAMQVNIREAKQPEVVVFAEDRLMRLRTTRRLKTYDNMSDADIAQSIAAEHGISAQVDADGPTYDVVQQWNQSDLAFLRSRARMIQAEVWLDSDTLFFQNRAARTGTQIAFQNGELLSVEARADLAHQRTQITVSGYDASARTAISEDADVSAVSAEVSSGRTGVAILETAFGARVSYRVRDVPLTTAEAAAFAKAEMLRRARAFVTVSGLTNGTPNMVVGSQVTLASVGTPFEGPGYYVTRVMHTYDLTTGFRTHFNAERATIQEGS